MKLIQSPDTLSVIDNWAAGCTHQGRRRDYQQDAFMLYPHWVAVADGMGGHQFGDLAAQYAIEAVTRTLGNAAELTQAVLFEAFAAAQTATQRDKYPIMPSLFRAPGTTLMVAGMNSVGDWLVANVGDSRTYSFKDGVLEQVTEDHEGFGGGLTAWVGGASHAPDIFTVDGDKTLILASDGLFLELTDEEIAAIMSENETHAEQAMALVRAANEAGGRDNITAVVVGKD